MNRILLACLVVLTVLVCLGCGNKSGNFPVAKASGVVFHEGQPVANVMVTFVPLPNKELGNVSKTGARAFAETDKDGKFVLSTYNSAKKDGAVVGKHEVMVSETPDSNTSATLSLHKKVAVVEVKKGEKNEFTIELPAQSTRAVGYTR